jgi:hypothetical protein
MWNALRSWVVMVLLLGWSGLAWAGPGNPARNPELERTLINWYLDNMAAGVAQALKREDVRLLIQREAALERTGDSEALLENLEQVPLRDGRRFTELVVQGYASAAAARGRHVSREEADSSIRGLTSRFRNVHVAVRPAGTSWAEQDFIPLVAFSPVGFQEEELQEIVAYDIHGNRHLLDPHRAPEVPVLVVGLNERTDIDGNARWSSATMSVADEVTTAEESLVEVVGTLNVRDDNEDWIDGDAEIMLKVKSANHELYTGSFTANWDKWSGRVYNRPLFTYYPSSYGPWVVYFWYEEDGGWSPINVNVGVNYNGVSATVGFQLMNNDDPMGHATLGYADTQLWYDLGDLVWSRHRW